MHIRYEQEHVVTVIALPILSSYTITIQPRYRYALVISVNSDVSAVVQDCLAVTSI